MNIAQPLQTGNGAESNTDAPTTAAAHSAVLVSVRLRNGPNGEERRAVVSTEIWTLILANLDPPELVHCSLLCVRN